MAMFLKVAGLALLFTVLVVGGSLGGCYAGFVLMFRWPNLPAPLPAVLLFGSVIAGFAMGFGIWITVAALVFRRPPADRD